VLVRHNLHLPRVVPEDLWSALAHQSPQDVSHTVGFAVIGIIWIDHHSQLQRIGAGCLS